MALMFRSVLQNAGGAAELIVTCDSEFAGATISCSDGTTTLNKTCPSSSPYEVTFKIPNSGDWTISATVSGTAYTSDPISVELDYTALLEYGFNWRRWVDTAQYLDSTDYSTLSDLFADEEALRELCLEHACVDYLAAVPSVNTDIETIINNDLFAKWVNNSDYSLDILGANVVIKALMDTADKYFYGEWTLMPQVPKMTSNTAPYGVVTADSEYTDSPGYQAYKAFDGGDIGWSSRNADGWIKYDFGKSVHIDAIAFLRPYNTGSKFDKFELSVSNDDTNYTIIKSDTLPNNNTEYLYKGDVDDNGSYRYFKLRCYGGTDWAWIKHLQFYAWQPKGNVPVMTSNTAPYGEVFATSNRDAAYLVFDGNDSTPCVFNTIGTVGYKFTNPICPKRFYLDAGAENGGIYYKIQGSNTGNSDDWEDITSEDTSYPDIDMREYGEITTNKYYLYLRVVIRSHSGSDWFVVRALQFYGRELSVSVPTMTSNTTPYGEVGGNRYVTGDSLDLYGAFNQVTSNYTQVQNGGKIYYKFNKPTVVKKVGLFTYSSVSAYVNNMQLIGSNDNGATWQNIGTAKTPISQQAIQYFDYADNEEAFSVIGISVNAPNSENPAITILQFYGEDYSEKEFEEGTTKKWLYDHGVVLGSAIERIGSAGGSIENNGSQYELFSATTNRSSATFTMVAFREDLSAYSNAFVKVGDYIRPSTDGDSYSATYRLAVDNNGTFDTDFPNNGNFNANNLIAAYDANSPNLRIASLNISSISGINPIMVYESWWSNVVASFKELWLE